MNISDRFFGKTFVWWVGVVEDRNDPLKIGRCKVRILGWHTDELNDLPTDDLPWANVILPVTSASLSGVGHSPTGLVEGTWVIGFFKDSYSAQDPIIIGSLPGIQSKKNKNSGFADNRTNIDLKNDPSFSLDVNVDKSNSVDIISEEETYPKSRYIGEPTTPRLSHPKDFLDGDIYNIEQINIKNKTRFISDKDVDLSDIDEPLSKFNSKYPFNHVYQSESGHFLEFDDTRDSERVQLYHRAGSFLEFSPNGSLVQKIMGDMYLGSQNNFTLVTRGESKEIVHKGKNIHVNSTETSGGDLNTKVGRGGNFNLNVVDGDINFKSGGGSSNINFNAANYNFQGNGNLKFNQKAFEIITQPAANRNMAEIIPPKPGEFNITTGSNFNLDVGGTIDVIQCDGYNIKSGLSGIKIDTDGSKIEKINGTAFTEIFNVALPPSPTLAYSTHTYIGGYNLSNGPLGVVSPLSTVRTDALGNLFMLGSTSVTLQQGTFATPISSINMTPLGVIMSNITTLSEIGFSNGKGVFTINGISLKSILSDIIDYVKSHTHDSPSGPTAKPTDLEGKLTVIKQTIATVLK